MNKQNKLHIGIILDGNRRYAKSKGLKPWDGHKLGAEKVEQLFTWAKELGITELSLYCWSMQNFSRDVLEKKFIFKIFEKSFDKLTQNKKKLDENNVKIQCVGRLHLFPKKLQEKMRKIIEMTKNNTEFTINFCMAYGGREEIVDAVLKIADDLEHKKLTKKEINEEKIQEKLYLNSEPDLIIRPGGEKRTSNFLMWQSAYTEWFFLNKFWPEIEKKDIANCISEFSQRERRFGK